MSKLAHSIPDGYELTEHGVFPKEWDIKAIGEIASVSSGGTPNRKVKDFWDGDIPWVTTTLINGNDISYANEFITKKGLESSSAKMCKAGTILMAMYGQGKTRGKTGILTIDASINQACAAIEINSSDSSEYILHILNYMYEDIRELSNSGGQENLSSGIIKGIKLPLPSKSEQTAIANTLSDVDALLTEMETLIAKKQAIKTATMQQLLTGKTRLPQFAMREDGSLKRTKQSDLGEIPEDWEVYNLPDVVWYQEGPGLRKWQFKAKGLKVINVTNLQQNGFLDLDRTDRHISWDEYEKTYKHFACDEGDLVIASSGNSYCKSSTIRKCDLPLLMNTSVIRFKPVGDFSKGFMDVYLKSPYFKDQIDLLITGGAQPNFGPAHLNKIKIPAPANPEEQTAIATILSDMDNEIQTLEQRLAKTRQIKQGMMQELLTGRTRLPFDKA